MHLKRPHNDELFVVNWIYEYGLEFEYSLLALAIGNAAQALGAADRLLENPELPPERRPEVEETRRDALEAMRSQAAISGYQDDRAAVVSVRIEEAAGTAGPWRVSWLLPTEDAEEPPVPDVLNRAVHAIREAVDELGRRSQAGTGELVPEKSDLAG